MLADKTPVQIVTVIEGTGRVTLDARFRGVRDFGFGFPLYECELADAAAHVMGGVAQGMSGSPVGPPGRIMGALAYGNQFSGTPHRFWVTAIDAMDATITHETFGDLLDKHLTSAAPSAKVNAAYTPIKTPLMITGIQPNRLQQLSSYLKGSRYDFIEIFADVGGTVDTPVHNTTSLAAGDMIGVAITRGDVVNTFGFGTVTQVYDDKFIAFGHPMNGDGHAALPVYRAVVRGIVPNLEVSYKSAAAYGDPIGTITKDLTPAIVGQLGVLPEMIPVKVTYQIDDGEPVEKNHEVAYRQEAFIAMVAATTANTIRQETSPGTVDGTFTLRFKETEKTYTKSYRVASPDLFTATLSNVSSAIASFTDIFSNDVGMATLTEVSVSITETPVVKTAAVQDVIVPEVIIPGESATFKIMIFPHWSATQGGERMLQREVTFDIPEDFPIGDAQLRVEAGDEVDSFFLGGDFLSNSFDETDEDTPMPKNLEEYITQLEERQTEKGLITITLSQAGSDHGLFFGDVSDEMSHEPIEKEIVIEGFIVNGKKEITVDISEPEEPVVEGQ